MLNIQNVLKGLLDNMAYMVYPDITRTIKKLLIKFNIYILLKKCHVLKPEIFKSLPQNEVIYSA